ncbi:MAG TPA: DUF1553 domain-containing protein, partial [Planctomycetota bacterium]|nr:DUF1553 domain-containing protein [Planctomycetota bacterium]
CHDHKFDPIPTRDYYAIAGILRSARVLEHSNVSKWLEDPLPVEPEREAELRKHEEAIAALQKELNAEKVKAGQAARQAAETAKGVLAVADVPGIVVDDTQAEKVGVWKDSTHSGVYIGAGYTHDQNDRKGESSLTFQAELRAGRYEVRFAYSPGASRAASVPVTILSADGEKVIPVNMKETPTIDGRFVSLGQYRFETNQGYVLVSNEGTDGHVTADAVAFIEVEKLAAAKAKAPKTPETAAIKALEAEIKRLQQSGPKRELAMSLREEKKPVDLRIHIRGSVHTLGELAPRGVLQVALDGPPPAMPADRSGRLELADWVAGADNPLTARVMANRVWHWIFGAGLVRTTDNFGTTGETPSHPELLDHLAQRFVQDGWSVKTLIRRIVTTDAYRRSSAVRASDVDPDNRLLARMSRRRMDAESLRDALLAVAGRLDLEGGGPTFKADLASDYAYKHTEPVRSVYVPVFRNALPDIFAAFDFADPSLPTGRRDVSTVAPQALFMLNNPFVREQARAAAERLLKESHADDRARAVRAWRLALGRPPSAVEQDLALRHAAGAPSPESGWTDVVHALFASVDFRYVE